MDFQQYQDYFQEILNDPNAPAPYNNIEYLDYTKLNWTRQQRWLKTGVVEPDLALAISDINEPQHWIIITEPWCGDASHTVPFIYKLSTLNPLIRAEYQLRDSAPHLIEQYLTNGGKAIPKLVIRDEAGNDLLNWGPRPTECQSLYQRLKAEEADFGTIKTELQKWYNQDKGRSFQSELHTALKSLV
ncbi:thioredoxin family protein [Pedobacter sp. JY14-1]|uniref:thioredoxin family protein n=1 Tax=Pedobacter sp. JY14-1 TaxID=3034151 RepID=UPI0023E0D0FE|nr:thioredoxin family protein [Pedobacter sp. JY14-1]